MRPIEKLHEVMAALRDPDNGCPWDLEQNSRTIAPHTIEEAYEVFDAIERNDIDDLRDELGDLLFHVVFHARLAEEAGHFDFNDVARAIVDKLERRHPHVFGTVSERDARQVAANWEQIKADERAELVDKSALAGVARALPALKRAQKLGNRAASVGFDWPDRLGVDEKIREELGELEVAVGSRDRAAIDEEFGDLLFAVVNLARHLQVDPEAALTAANYKFERRFRAMEQNILRRGKQLSELTLESLDQEWRAAKQRLKGEQGSEPS
ncbi:MAG: nucleoside triphosphate pyrophosphohydrolase [Gammaproteobacteria bacterium]|nr:nucleoside triphosphate pyrophosphohydrolase [Gammaproteobacteria bacterium]